MRFLTVGHGALLVEVDGLAQVRALRAEIDRRRAAGWLASVLDVIPAARTVLLDGIDDVAAAARDISSWDIRPAAAEAGPVAEIPCRYDGPDLRAVAEQWGVPAPDVGRIHSSVEYEVAFCGFAPGFAYLTGTGPARTVQRRDSPRTSIPAGSVGLGGAFTGIYPRASPGGWQIIGRTDAVMWDAGRDPAALLAAGDRVRFIQVSP